MSSYRNEKTGKRRPKSYDLFGLFTFFLPGVGVSWLLVAGFFALQLVVGLVMSLFLAGGWMGMDGYLLLTYVTTFALLLIPCSTISRAWAFRIEKGLAVSSRHFGKMKVVPMMAFCMVGMVAAVLAIDPVSTWFQSWAPDAETLKQTNETLMAGSSILVFLQVGILAPLFEELFCRGILLRGMLTHVRPGWAILMSALMFAFMHFNIAQGFVAFCLGLLLGYVYYKTGSLWLTMLMHATNNIIGFFLMRYPDAQAAVEGVPVWAYILMVVAGVAFTVLFIRQMGRIPKEQPFGNCDPVAIEDLI